MRTRDLGLAIVALVAGTLCVSAHAESLPETKPLTLEQPLDVLMLDGLHRYARRETAESPQHRAAFWKRDYSNVPAYEQSIAGNRERLARMLGVVDPRIISTGLRYLSTTFHPALVGKGAGYRVLAVRWKVLDGMTAEGLLLEPDGDPTARIIAIPDADWTPEMLVGMVPGPQHAYARRLAEQGMQVLIPTLISREDTFSGNPEVRMTNQPHREWVYRQAFEMGRHVIGYEVQKILSAVDHMTYASTVRKFDLPIGVFGVGEGGLLALYSAALDPRIDAAVVSGYFEPREQLWQEPIYRNLFGVLREFGDADIASLVAPRSLVIEAAAPPTVAGPPAPRTGRAGAAPGRIHVPELAAVQAEFKRAAEHFRKLNVERQLQLIVSGNGTGPAGTDQAIAAFQAGLGITTALRPSGTVPRDLRDEFSPAIRQRDQLEEMVEFTQRLVRGSARARDKFWKKADRTSVASWEKTTPPYRQYIHEELIGKLPKSTMPLNPRTRQVLDNEAFRGYEVLLDVYPDIVAGGILLLPKDLKPGEKRPVVVCQHGLNGVPMDTITTEGRAATIYKSFAAELARRGFITYAPQNPYRGGERFRELVRIANPMKRTLFSYIIPQHERTLEFLGTLPNVDTKRIGFYGLSYGGKTAVRVPPLVEGYALSICSADYNEWIRKITDLWFPSSYMFTGEYEIDEWNMGHVANYAELANLMTPRPFMVERGHHDGVAPDEWVAWEYSKVRRHYNLLGLGDKTEIEFFNGPHSIHGERTYDFLHKHLNWPRK